MKRKLIALCLIVAISLLVVDGCSKQTNAITGRTTVKVERIVDGDTIEIKLDGKKEKVRFIGMDTPETKKPKTSVMFFGKEASEYTKKRLDQQTVELEWDVERKDKYDRLLAYVWIGDELLNETLLQEGYARLSTFPPNVKYVKRFTKAQEQARKKENGLWKDYQSAFDSKK